MDGVKVALGNRGMTMEAARRCAKDRKEWRALVSGGRKSWYIINYLTILLLLLKPAAHVQVGQ